MQVKPIKNNKDYEAALHRIENLMDAKDGTADSDELDILSTLVEAYEDAHFPIDAPDPIAAIEHCMEALNLDRKDLEKMLGSKSKVSEVLNKKRKLSMEMVRSLNKKMGIPADILIRDYKLKKPSTSARRKSVGTAA
jgi:HTH-type transcriptional regulator/antitoxin HigA